jgi:2-oxoacid:acceptor oxidoreductase gamma subunit (pyruvate/2-ketoisovalerate family)
MLEIKFMGRGGQGVVVASQILARVYFLMGLYPQCFSVFGGERRGAPVASFLRVDRQKVLLKCAIQRPDHLIYMAPDLLDEKEVVSTLKPGGWVLINESMGRRDYQGLANTRVALVDALAVAQEAGLGGTINTAVLGAYVRASQAIPLQHLERAIFQSVPSKVDQNLQAARLAYHTTRFLQGETG